MEDQDDLLTRLQVIYFTSSGARDCILHLDPVTLSCDLFIRLDNEMSLPGAHRGNFSLNQKAEGAVPRMDTDLMVGVPPHHQGACKIRSQGRELVKITHYYKDLHMWRTV